MRRIRILLWSAAGRRSGFGWQLHIAMQVAVGYSAKQLCSGVFVSGLPAEFVVTRDILPRMALLGRRAPCSISSWTSPGRGAATPAGYRQCGGGLSVRRGAAACTSRAAPSAGNPSC